MTALRMPQMPRYINVKVNISQGQKDKISKAAHAGTGVSIRLSHEDLSGDHVLALTQAQINKMTESYQNGTGITVKISKPQLDHNMKVEGGFLPALLGILGSTVLPFLLKSAIPALATGALSGIARASTEASGSAIYVKRGENSFKVVPAGQGLYLRPWNKGSSISASGLYVKKGNGYVDGRGLLFGPDSPFKNIPILGMIL